MGLMSELSEQTGGDARPVISIAGQAIGPGYPAFIIAEAGVNHNGSVDIAAELITAAAECGANCVKFQTFSAERVAMERAPKAAYQLEVTDESESQIDMLRSLELAESAYPDLINLCTKHGVAFLSTPYNEEDVDFLVHVGCPALKLASIHAAEPSMLRYAAQTGLPLIVSTGMATKDEVAVAVDTIRTAGNNAFVVLQCTTNYPSPVSDANLRAMTTMARVFDVAVGYSDHTESDLTAVAAVALGACVLEKHFTLDKTWDGPDQSTSLDQAGLKSYVKAVRDTEAALGTGVKAPAQHEIRNIEGMRRSIVARHTLDRGSIIAADDLILKRPATGIPARHFDSLVGRRVTETIEQGTQVTWESIEGKSAP